MVVTQSLPAVTSGGLESLPAVTTGDSATEFVCIITSFMNQVPGCNYRDPVLNSTVRNIHIHPVLYK